MPLRGMALRQQSTEAGRAVPPQRPIPGLARDVVALAELRHRFLTGLVLQDKPQLFLHDTARFPWHRRSFLEAPAIHSQCQESSRSNLSGISPVRTGLRPPSPPRLAPRGFAPRSTLPRQRPPPPSTSSAPSSSSPSSPPTPSLSPPPAPTPP